MKSQAHVNLNRVDIHWSGNTIILQCSSTVDTLADGVRSCERNQFHFVGRQSTPTLPYDTLLLMTTVTIYLSSSSSLLDTKFFGKLGV